MDIKQLEALGITAEDLTDRIVERATEELLTTVRIDEDGEEAGRTRSSLARKVEDNIRKHTDAKIQALAEQHILPNVANYIESLTLQETNRWGERTGQKLTFIEYLTQRADAYMREEVNSNGKSKQEEGGYSWSAHSTRVAHMVSKQLHYSIETAMKAALAHANSSISQGLEGAVKIALANATASLKVAVTNK